VPTLYARLDAGRYACFLMDYCSGGDLHAVLRRRPGGRLPVAAARFYAAEVLLALEYLHALGFVYRDLKPENVLLRGDGELQGLRGHARVPRAGARERERPRQRRGLVGLRQGRAAEEEEQRQAQLTAEADGMAQRG